MNLRIISKSSYLTRMMIAWPIYIGYVPAVPSLPVVCVPSADEIRVPRAPAQMTLLEKHKDNPESEGAMVAVCYLLSLFVPMYVLLAVSTAHGLCVPPVWTVR